MENGAMDYAETRGWRNTRGVKWRRSKTYAKTTGKGDVVCQLRGEDDRMVKLIWTVDFGNGSTARSTSKGTGVVGPGCYSLRLTCVQLRGTTAVG